MRKKVLVKDGKKWQVWLPAALSNRAEGFLMANDGCPSGCKSSLVARALDEYLRRHGA